MCRSKGRVERGVEGAGEDYAAGGAGGVRC